MKTVLAPLALSLALVSARSVAKTVDRQDEGDSRALRKTCDFPKFKNVFVFGDGLSDIGNMHSVDKVGTPTGRATNGKVAVETLSQKLGVSQSSSMHLSFADHPPGCNYAVRGARSTPLGTTPLLSPLTSSSATVAAAADVPEHRLPAQIAAFLGRHMKNNIPGGVDALYVIATGYEDAIDAASAVDRGDATVREAKDHLGLAASSVAASVRSLIDSGATYVMVVGPPSAGDAPRFVDGGAKGWQNRARRAGRLTEDLYGYTESAIEEVECDTGVEVVQVDAFGAADDDRYEFWNDIYPNKEGHEVLGESMMKSLKESICQNPGFPKKNMNKCKRNNRAQVERTLRTS